MKIREGNLAVIVPNFNRGEAYCEHMGVGKVERFNESTGKVTLWFDAVHERRVFSVESLKFIAKSPLDVTGTI